MKDDGKVGELYMKAYEQMKIYLETGSDASFDPRLEWIYTNVASTRKTSVGILLT